MTEEQFHHGKHRENEGIQFSQSTLANISRASQDSNSGLVRASARNGMRGREKERENERKAESRTQNNDVANEWRRSGQSLVERMKHLSFDGPTDEIKFRGRARRQESGTRGRWKWTALFGQRNKNIYLYRRSFARSVKRRFHWWKIPTAIWLQATILEIC